MADDKTARPAPDKPPASPPDLSTAPRDTDALSIHVQATAPITHAHAPPPMPTLAAAAPVTHAPPPMPTLAAAAPVTHAPPPMPTLAAAAASVTHAPPPMPTGAPSSSTASSSTAAPTMPTLAGQALDTSPPVMPTLAGAASLPSHQPPAMPPARYELGHEIARGGMGRVVDATDTMLGRVVAFKEALTTDGETLRRFQREIRITARLEHPSIVPVHDTGESSNGAPFYVMRKVSGQPLERLVATAETLPQRLALIPHIVASAQAIAHAHERGIVHRDIKPSNILVGDLGETVVIDWGLAKVIGEPVEPDDHVGKPLVDLSDSLKTRVGIVYGTPGFMAPEQLRGVPVTPGFDVYALGATLYHLLSRKPPHYAKTADEMMKAAVAAPPTPIREMVDGVSPELSTIVDKALAHDPAVRYQDARALAEDLQRFLTGQLVASHHYTPREKLMRFIRKNRRFSAAVAALVLVGTFAVTRIVIERNRADREAREARAAEATAVEQGDAKTLALARFNVDVNPTKAVAMVKPLAGKYWREARAIGAAARAVGVAWSIPASPHTVSLEMSHDGQRALSVGDDGAVRIYDLGKRTVRPILDLHTPPATPTLARYADAERQIVLWHGTMLTIVDAATGKRRDLTVGHPILDLEPIGAAAYWVDDLHKLWQLDLSAAAPREIPLQEPVVALAPSPDGRWIAFSGEDHLFLYDRTHPDAPALQVTMGRAHQVDWSDDSENFAALVDHEILDVAMLPVPNIVNRQIEPLCKFVAYRAGHVYVAGPHSVNVLLRDESPDARTVRLLPGETISIVEARGQTIVAGASNGLTVISGDGDHVVPLQAARAEGIVASPRSPYVVAQIENRLLLWNLDDIQPRRLVDEFPVGALFATADRVITGGAGHAAELPPQSIDAATGAAQPLGAWQGLQAVTATRQGQLVALIDDRHHVHLVGPGRKPEDLPGKIDIAAFATDDKLVLATLDGAIYVHDVEHHQRTPVGPQHVALLGLAWGHGRHPWVAAAFADGTLWRKNLATGVEGTAPRIPKPEHVSAPDGKLIVGEDGTVLFLHDREVHAWRADGSLGQLTQTPKPLDDFGELGTSQILAIARDTSVYAIARDVPDQVTPLLPNIDGTSAAMSPDAGLLVVDDHGAIDVVDPLGHQQWTLGQNRGVTFRSPAISPDGRRVLAQTDHSLVMWSLELPATPEATVAWLDALTNAIDDGSSRGRGWR